MKPNTTQDTMTLSHGVGETMTMSVAHEAMAHVMNALSNLYEDQIMAVIREYSTNARDSHIEAGFADRPITVSLPTREHLYFMVKDQGLGLDADGLRDIYASYGRSTKRESDAVQGMLGFGCKSGLTYAPQFQIIAIKNGTKISAIVCKDDDGVGTIKVFATVPTAEANGVTIKIPVKPGDVNTFHAKAERFYRVWDEGTVLVDGVEPPLLRDAANLVWLDDDVAVKLDSWEDSQIIMGNVAYPAKTLEVNWSNVQVFAWVSMGDVEFTPSREGLKDRSPRTVATIDALGEYVNERLVAHIMREIEDVSKTDFETAQQIQAWRTFLPRATVSKYEPTLPYGTDGWLLAESYDTERRATKHTSSYLLGHILNTQNHVLVNYPHKNVSGAMKRRLHKAAGYRPDGRQGAAGWVLLPEGTEAKILNGRPNVHRFEDLPELDKAERPERAKRVGPYKYTVQHTDGRSARGRVTTVEVEQVKGPVAYGTPDRSRWSSNQRTLHTYAQTLGLPYVELTPRQVEKFTRLHPQAVEVVAAYRAEQTKAQDALTEDDKRIVWGRSAAMHLSVLSRHVQDIVDPDLVEVVKLADATDNARIVAANKLGVSVPHPTVSVDAEVEAIANRYPLLTFSGYGRTLTDSNAAEAVIYFNAKYATLNV